MTGFASWLSSLGPTLLAGRAGLFLRVVVAGSAFVVAAKAFQRLPTAGARARAQIATSVALIAFLTTPWIAAIMVAYAIAFFLAVERMAPGVPRRGAIFGLIALQVVGPIWWLPRLPGYAGTVRELVAFATNMTQLRCWGYAYDRRTRADAPASFQDYALYMFFFPAFVSGPLLSFAEFQRGRLASYWGDGPNGDAPRDGYALRRVLTGLAIIPFVLSAVPAMSPAAYEAATHGPARAWLHCLQVYFAVYLGFSAWSECTIGLGRLGGVVLPENFNYAHYSFGVADFWRRWNIRLGRWMRDYVYFPLGGTRPGVGRVRTWINTGAVFLATAVYHHLGGLKLLGPGLLLSPAFYAGWLLWAAWNTPTTIASRTWRPPAQWTTATVAVMLATFLFEAMTLQTAFLPAGTELGRLMTIYRHLLFLP